ncbi:hypothetical protein EVAR_59162_1 [Eumeta japonica]|uniref:Uncharacterized protein n=1 Tax=Eumeta variegata TaxID=151549 RepID=A0A4C1YTL6_EUMVA|nr:hypothetical protein EVAR_59162_1 [Eumeta japonica]
MVPSESAMKKAASEGILPSQLLRSQSPEPNGSMESLRMMIWEDYGHPSHPTPSSFASIAAQPLQMAYFKELARHLGHAPSACPLGKGMRFIARSENEYRTV